MHAELIPAAAAVVLAAAGYLGISRDLRLLGRGLRDLGRGVPCVPRPGFFSKDAAQLWQYLLGNASLRKASARRAEEPVLSDLLHASRNIVTNVHQEQQTAEEACALLLRQTAPDSLAAAILFSDDRGILRLGAAKGIPAARLEQPLLTSVERLLANPPVRLTRHKIGLLRISEELLDLAAFGIGSSWFAQVEQEGEFLGGIWLGLSGRAGTFTPERLQLLDTLLQHLASSFSAARAVRRQIDDREAERKWLLGMSHDLRAPGNSALYSLGDLLNEEVGPLTTQQRLRLEIVSQCLREQMELVDDLLDLAKHREGLLRSSPSEFTPSELFAGLLPSFRLEAERKGLQLFVIGIPERRCFADIRQMRRVLFNLLSNAVKYTDHGSIWLRGELSPDCLLLSVEDTGIGVEATERDSLFREFSRLGESSTRPGAGLGLSVARTLSELNGGMLQYRPAESGGSSFTFALRLARPERHSGAAERLPPFRHILVVEDDAAARRVHARYLHDLGGSITAVASCEEAIACVAEHLPDLIVSDLMLERGSSEPLLQYLASRRIAASVILTTGSGDTPFLDSLQRRFGVSVVEKPLNRDILRAAVLSRLTDRGSRAAASSRIARPLCG